MSVSVEGWGRTHASRRIVLGLGNVLNHDEGLGVHALGALAAEVGAAANVEFADGGALGLALLPLVEECSHLLVLDAVDAGRPPGTLIELSGHEIPLRAGLKVSQHQVSFQEVLALAGSRDRLPPHLHLLGLQPADLSWGVGLHPNVAAMIPLLLQRARAVLREWR
jgi:hydrogenase maturation protease